MQVTDMQVMEVMEVRHMRTTREHRARTESWTPAFRTWQWRAGNALVSVLARLGVGPIALLTTRGRRTGAPHTVPVVPIEHDGKRWLVAPYGAVAWVHNARAAGEVSLRQGRHQRTYRVREVGPSEAGPVLARYVTIATRAARCFAAGAGAPAEAYAAEAGDHPVFELVPVAPTASTSA